MPEKKLIPLGIENFKHVAKNCYYVDKTSLVKDIVGLPITSVVLFARPRRFGKSLALSMLRNFFEISENDESELFKGTSIYQDKETIGEYFGKFPVVYLNFKNVIGEDGEYLLSKLRDCLKDEYNRHDYLLTGGNLNDFDKSYFESIVAMTSSKAELSSAVKNLTKFLFGHHHQRAIVLIDEYDTPLRCAYEKGFYDEVIGIFKSLFGEALKGNDDLHYAVLTGILQVGKESIFSGLNNLVVNTVLDEDMEEGFGFTEKEVDALLSYYGLSDRKGGFKEWYDGYSFGNAKIYNPLSVLSAIRNNGKVGPYWSNTSEKGALYDLLGSSSFDFQDLYNLLGNKSVESDVDLAISYLDINKSPSFLWSYLLATGYLTIKEKKAFDRYSLSLPNKEIQSVFEKEIILRYVPTEKTELLPAIKKAFLSEDARSVEYIFGKHLLNALSYYEIGKEKSYQIMLASILSLILDGYRIRSEVNAGNGRSDIVAFPSGQKDPGLIIEAKCLKGKASAGRMEASSLSAIRQIETKEYVREFYGSSVKEVLCCGICFSQRKCKVSFKRVRLNP